MSEHKEDRPDRVAGYEALIRRYTLDVIPHWHRSFVSASSRRTKQAMENGVEEVFPSQYWPGASLGDHLEFALKYDGINLALLASIFQAAEEEEFLKYVRSRPTGKYARCLWFLYEFLLNRSLPLEDLKQGNYVDLLDPKEYYTVETVRKVRRQRINDNLLGGRSFCPLVRRSDALQHAKMAELYDKCRRIVAAYPPELLKRALCYLYTKETKSSFEIEHIAPSSTRTERFVALLQLAEREDFCEKKRLIELQNRTVDPRFRDSGYRSTQNYVGETVAWRHEKIHFVCPKPEDLTGLMEGLIASHKRMEADNLSPVVHAAAVAYGFVFLHPFEDGNGRIHRFLIHNILARRGFTPRGIMFPISAAMLKNVNDYNASLAAFSNPLMSLAEYTLDDTGRMTVHNDTALWYRYMDMTPQVEALFRFVERTIETELVEELAFLANYDKTKNAIQKIVDMPDQQIDLFIRFCLQNNGRLSKQKRAGYFSVLSDTELVLMEKAVQASYGNTENTR
ncbi:MAG: Fic family protein [Candidatus Hydrogenedentes bacterium]|nr:Fic family protein [Candidatus Hydrogenedentota bacterium]